MATSGSVDHNRTANQIIKRAMRHMAVLAQEEEPTASEQDAGLEALNALVKAWQAEGINLWKYEEGILWLVAGTTQYSIGPSGDNAASTWVKTTTSAAASSGASAIVVTSATGIVAAYNIGIILDDGTLQWNTVASVSGSTVNLDNTLNDAVAKGNQVWSYQSKIVRPLRISNPRRRDSADQDIPIFTVSREEYFATPNKNTQSPPVNVYYDPQLTNGEIHLWSAPDTAKDTILFTAKMPIEDFDAATNTPDLPQEWLRAIAWNLADEQALEYEIPADRHARINVMALKTLAAVEAFDHEPESVYFQPDFEQ